MMKKSTSNKPVVRAENIWLCTTYQDAPTAESGSVEQVARSTRIKGYGNAIVPQTAATFIEAVIRAEKTTVK
jgi:hypothetical protein